MFSKRALLWFGKGLCFDLRRMLWEMDAFKHGSPSCSGMQAGLGQICSNMLLPFLAKQGPGGMNTNCWSSFRFRIEGSGFRLGGALIQGFLEIIRELLRSL